MGVLADSPSAKALGKRPALSTAPEIGGVPDLNATAAKETQPVPEGTRPRRKRTTASQSGGPSFGASDVDVSILESMESLRTSHLHSGAAAV